MNTVVYIHQILSKHHLRQTKNPYSANNVFIYAVINRTVETNHWTVIPGRSGTVDCFPEYDRRKVFIPCDGSGFVVVTFRKKKGSKIEPQEGFIITASTEIVLSLLCEMTWPWVHFQDILSLGDSMFGILHTLSSSVHHSYNGRSCYIYVENSHSMWAKTPPSESTFRFHCLDNFNCWTTNADGLVGGPRRRWSFDNCNKNIKTYFGKPVCETRPCETCH